MEKESKYFFAGVAVVVFLWFYSSSHSTNYKKYFERIETTFYVMQENILKMAKENEDVLVSLDADYYYSFDEFQYELSNLEEIIQETQAVVVEND